jgi:threonine aldolase
MANQIAIRISTQPQDQVICDKKAHIYLYEGGGVAANSLVSTRLVDGDRGRISPQQVLDNINPEDQHFPRTTLVSLENTSNKGGGSYYTLREIAAISGVCKAHDLRLHLDGARVFNALTATGESSHDYGQYFDTISFCLSKGLGTPVGSLLLGSKIDIHRALRVRKMMGGGMRQAGFLAAAGRYALGHHIERLADDHRRAKALGAAVGAHPGIEDVMPVDTNIIAFKPDPAWKEEVFLRAELEKKGIRASVFGGGYLRFVTHLDIDDNMIDYVMQTFRQLPG